MLCERCRAEIQADPMPDELVQVAGLETMRSRVLRLLWDQRGRWVSTEWLIVSAYRGGIPPLAAENCVNVAVHHMRKLLPRGYRIEAHKGYGRRLLVGL
jgi:hypothetical protein